MNKELPDNLSVAMDAVMKNESLTIKSNTKSQPGNPAAKQFLLRLTPEEHNIWKVSAELRGVALAEMVRDSVREYLINHPVSEGGCLHPEEQRRVYPWAEICGVCKKRF